MTNDQMQEILDHGPGRMVCPVCEGGSTHERSMSVQVDDKNPTVLWATCFRGTCDVSSMRINGTTMHVTTMGREVAPTEWAYNGDLFPLCAREGDNPGARMVDARWPWLLKHSSEHDIRYAPELEAVMFPVFDAAGITCHGWVPKALAHGRSLKHMRFVEPGYTAGAWYGDAAPDDIIFVEDCLSAVRIASAGYTVMGVALLGTYLSPAAIAEARAEFPEARLHLALDADATRAALRQAIKFRSMVEIAVHRLYRDIKDCTDEEVDEFLSNL